MKANNYNLSYLDALQAMQDDCIVEMYDNYNSFHRNRFRLSSGLIMEFNYEFKRWKQSKWFRFDSITRYRILTNEELNTKEMRGY